jgi:transposase
MLASKAATVHVGIDMSKAEQVVHILPSNQHFTLANDTAGRAELVRRLKQLPVARIVLEPSGSYEQATFKTLRAAGLPVFMVPAEKIRAFALATRGPLKTDAIDAQVLAHYAELFEPPAPMPRGALAERLHELLLLREQFVAWRAAAKCKLEQAQASEARRVLRAEIKHLDGRVACLERSLRTTVASDADAAELCRRLRTAPGIGELTAFAIIADLPELGRLDRRKIARLVGVAPIARDSGASKGYRATHGGRFRLRRILFMGVLGAVSRANADNALADFYRRRLDNGTAAKAAVVAAINKLLARLNAMVRHRRDWADHPIPA